MSRVDVPISNGNEVRKFVSLYVNFKILDKTGKKNDRLYQIV